MHLTELARTQPDKWSRHPARQRQGRDLRRPRWAFRALRTGVPLTRCEGRASRGAVNVYSHEVAPDVAVFGEVVTATVQQRDPSRAGLEWERELIAHGRECLSHVKCPRSIDFDAQLPRSDNSKLCKKQVPAYVTSRADHARRSLCRITR